MGNHYRANVMNQNVDTTHNQGNNAKIKLVGVVDCGTEAVSKKYKN